MILKRTDKDVYQYIPIRNQNTGTRLARGLYTADKAEVAAKVMGMVFAGTHEVYASFHTHPIGFPAMPSMEDLTKLFTGHPINYIYAPQEDVLNMFIYQKGGGREYVWQGVTINL